jgi:hypothetical protein
MAAELASSSYLHKKAGDRDCNNESQNVMLCFDFSFSGGGQRERAGS